MKKAIGFVLAGAVALAGMSGPVSAGDNAKGKAVIKGKVTFDGTPPKTGAIPVANDPVCTKAQPKGAVPDQATIVYATEGNAVPYVFVFVSKGIDGKYDAPKEAVVLDQQGCTYHPHVFGMVAGQNIDIKNSDNTNHNVHSLPTKNTMFNFAQPTPGTRTLTGPATFGKPEMAVKIKCDVHPWMGAWCHVMSHPFFAVTVSHENDGGDKSKRGTFEIKELPAGTYELTAWHEKFGTVTQSVTVGDGETKEIEFKIAPKAALNEPAQPSREVMVSAEGSEAKDAVAKPACCKAKAEAQPEAGARAK